ncbi:MAG: hypothetical protein LBR90_03080 [Elusimicrobiota bacterium]|jgi:hypothetical protein|nr:hypothetical protein [Elusimicrobiota bacterium]
MEKLMHSIKAPFKKGFICGVLDMCFRFVALVIWLCTVWLLLQFVYDALFVEIIWANKMWWLAYSLLVFLAVTTLAYTAVWDRE